MSFLQQCANYLRDQRLPPGQSLQPQSWKGTRVSFWEAVICIVLKVQRKVEGACMTGKPTLSFTFHPPFLPGLLLHHQEVQKDTA